MSHKGNYELQQHKRNLKKLWLVISENDKLNIILAENTA